MSSVSSGSNWIKMNAYNATVNIVLFAHKLLTNVKVAFQKRLLKMKSASTISTVDFLIAKFALRTNFFAKFVNKTTPC